MSQRVAALFSGGKESTYTVWVLQHQGWEIVSLVTVRPKQANSWMFHYPNVEWTRLQAKAMVIPHRMVEATGKDELADLESALVVMKREMGIVGVATGAVASDYQKTRFDNMCHTIGLKSYSPLWHKRPELLVDDLKKAAFRVIVTGVAAAGLDEDWLGKELTGEQWQRLDQLSKKHGIHLTGEGGEYESFVLDAPHFQKRIEIDRSKTFWDGHSGRLVIEAASLRNKLSN